LKTETETDNRKKPIFRLGSVRSGSVFSFRCKIAQPEVEVVKDQHQPRWNEWDDEEPKAPTKEESIPPKSNPQTK
jgi:hypothetical protein